MGVVLLMSVCWVVAILFVIAWLTTFERKVLGSAHRRWSTVQVGFLGLLQGLCDGLKLSLKSLQIERFYWVWLPVWIAAPAFIFAIALFVWSLLFVPHLFGTVSFFSDVSSLLAFLAFSSLSVYGILYGGWASDSKYSLLGALRSTSQMISYEVILLMSVLPVSLLSSSLDFASLTLYSTHPLNVIVPFSLFLVSLLAETNRTPFDLPEAEAELVAGYNVEYSAIGFALFFLSEYSSMSSISVAVYDLYGSFSSFLLLYPIFLSYLLFIRVSLPRLRFDQLISLCWIYLLPLLIAYFIWLSVDLWFIF